VAQTENAIQNIILDELENFDGIFMATTNLVKNIDTAFDRRFLFKVEFQKPDIVAKAMIWQSKLPWLLPEDCQLLAKQFDFPGGQIDNVVRKVEVEAIINDNFLSFELVTLFCNQELMVRESRGRVGF
jgi:SpoVK/Ycf46/Vps4 family AAA+-type ATPase